MSSIFTTPWIPRVNGQPLGQLEAYDVICEEGVVPNSVQHGAWTERALNLVLANVPEGRKALWECVLALWRLQLVRGDDPPSELWKLYIITWLVRSSRSRSSTLIY